MPDADKQFTIKVDTEGLVETNKGFQTTEDYLKKVAEATKTSGKEFVKHSEHVAGATLKHGQLKQMVMGLKHEFPELGRIMHLALHPVTLSVAAIAGSFKLFQYRVEELAKTFSQPELKQAKLFDPEHINAAKQAWEGYTEAIKKGKEALESVRQVAKETTQELANAETRWKNIADAQREWLVGKQKAAGVPEENLAAIGKQRSLRESFEPRERSIALKAASIKDMRSEAERKKAEAAGIKIGSSSDDKGTIAQLKAEYEEASLKGAESQQNITDAEAIREKGFFGKVPYLGKIAKFSAKYGVNFTVEQIRKAEQPNIDRERELRERYSTRAKEFEKREKLRKRREQLLSDAATIENEADVTEREASLSSNELKKDRIGVRQQELAGMGLKPGSVLGQTLDSDIELFEKIGTQVPKPGQKGVPVAASEGAAIAKLIASLKSQGNSQAQIEALLSMMVDMTKTHEQKVNALLAALKQSKQQQVSSFIP